MRTNVWSNKKRDGPAPLALAPSKTPYILLRRERDRVNGTERLSYRDRRPTLKLSL